MLLLRGPSSDESLWNWRSVRILRAWKILPRYVPALMAQGGFRRLSSVFYDGGEGSRRGLMHYLLFYEVSDDYVARRTELRNLHLEKAWAASGRGELVLGGALANPVDGAVLLFKGDSPEVAENFAKSDPYVLNGLVKRWYVREWTTVAGEHSAVPVKPV
jgi:uncharacterized protein YciI